MANEQSRFCSPLTLNTTKYGCSVMDFLIILLNLPLFSITGFGGLEMMCLADCFTVHVFFSPLNSIFKMIVMAFNNFQFDVA